jgi:hypothetical protein
MNEGVNPLKDEPIPPGTPGEEGYAKNLYKRTRLQQRKEALAFLEKFEYVDPWRAADEEPYYEFPDTSWSQFNHPAGYVANARYLAKTYPEVIELRGGDSWGEAVIPEKNIPKLYGQTLRDLKQELKRLENYPLLDEEGASRIESERQDEAWKDWARSEFINELEKKFDDEIEASEDPDGMRERLDLWGTPPPGPAAADPVWDFFVEKCDEANEYWEEDSTGDQYIRINRIVEEVEWEDFYNRFLVPTGGLPIGWEDPRQMRFSFAQERRDAHNLAMCLLEGHNFSCVMADLPEDVAHKIIAWGHQHIPNKDLFVDKDGGLGRETDIHATVKYGLLDPVPTEELLAVFADTEPFEIQLAPASLFEQEDHDVVKLDVISPALHNLNRRVCQAAPYFDTHPTYIPHITIAYVKKGMGDHLVGHHPFESIEKLGVSSIATEGRLVIDRVVFSSHTGQKFELPLGQPMALAAK